MNLDQNKATLSLHIGTPAQTNMSFGQEDTPSRGMLIMYWHRVVIPVSKSCANSWKKLVITASV